MHKRSHGDRGAVKNGQRSQCQYCPLLSDRVSMLRALALLRVRLLSSQVQRHRDNWRSVRLQLSFGAGARAQVRAIAHPE
jgi:hypothetical protein